MSVRLLNSVFVHVPRTGGLWTTEVCRQLGLVKQVLKGDIDGHLRFCDLPDRWRALKSFGIVRHPLAWLRSRWSHALEHNVVADWRHEGVHREFDECVRGTFQETVEEILRSKPGLVSVTYYEMLKGVKWIIRTEDLPDALLSVLMEYEGVKRLPRVAKFNSTSTMAKYCFDLSPGVADRLLSAEAEAMKLWTSAS